LFVDNGNSVTGCGVGIFWSLCELAASYLC
jgi:hypothetical protein